MARAVDFASIRGLRVGHAQTPDGATGVSVVVFDTITPTVVDVRGGASATYDTASLSLDATFGRRWALFLTGGSLYGLDAARGIRVHLLESGVGATAFQNPNPIVQISGAALFDLPRDPAPIPDYLPLGYEAARNASDGPTPEGRVGAGSGAWVGKYLGRDRAMRGGLAARATELRGRGRIGALIAINAVGAVRDPRTGRWVAGARGRRGVEPPVAAFHGGDRTSSTTLGIVATDLRLERATLQRMGAIVHAGLAAAISPFHSSTDGDVLFVAATGAAGRPPKEGRPGGTADRLGSIAASLAVDAVLAAVRVGNRKR
jgi:L-aminopeptidase/D-esterase-like protein